MQTSLEAALCDWEEGAISPGKHTVHTIRQHANYSLDNCAESRRYYNYSGSSFPDYFLAGNVNPVGWSAGVIIVRIVSALLYHLAAAC